MTEGRSNPTPAKATREQGGTVLVLFALLLVGVFGLLGAVVDGGRLRVTRQQMDAGAECAALEGLRHKDVEGDAARRSRAIAAAANLFDDDLDASNGDAIGLGAGSLPIVSGVAPLGGSIQAAVTPAARTWKPAQALEQNLVNAAHGDLVAGAHDPTGIPTEDDLFDRGDFTPEAVGTAAATLAAAPAFLVRLRRASERLALDRDPGQSSAGPPFEWLWARGSAWQEPVAGQGNASRNDGLTLRAASIAAAERALTVSADPAQGLALATFALRADGATPWQATPAGGALTLNVDATGQLLLAGAEEGIALAAASQLVGAPAARSPTLTPPSAGTLLVPVYADLAGARRVLGFTLAEATLSGGLLTVQRRAGAVLPTGASAASPAALDARLALESNPTLRALHASISEPVLAPVLRR